MEVRGVAAQLRALQAGRGRGSREGEEETEEVGTRRVMRVEVGVGEGRRRVRWDTIGGRDAQHVFVVVGEGGDEVGLGAGGEGWIWALVCGCRSQLAVERVRPPIRNRWLSGLGLQLQLALRAGAIYEVQTSTKTVHALAHVIQRRGEPERAVRVDVDGGGANQGEPVSLLAMFGRRRAIRAEGGD